MNAISKGARGGYSVSVFVFVHSERFWERPFKGTKRRGSLRVSVSTQNLKRKGRREKNISRHSQGTKGTHSGPRRQGGRKAEAALRTLNRIGCLYSGRGPIGERKRAGTYYKGAGDSTQVLCAR